MTRDRVVCFGDIVNDIVVVPRLEIRPDTDTPSTIRPRPGGSAANTAAWLGSLGAAVDFVGCVGTADAEHHADVLRENGVEPHLVAEPGLPTSSIVIVVESGRRTMLTDRGANAALSADALPDRLLASAAVLHLTGYSLLDGPRASGVQELIARAHDAGVVVSLTPGSAGFMADYGAAGFRHGIAGVDILVANLEEAALLSDAGSPEEIARDLGDRHGIAVVTRGPGDVLVAERDRRIAVVEVPRARVLDPTGAGDAMAAGFLRSWIRGRDAVAAADAGVRIAARALMILGGRPPI